MNRDSAITEVHALALDYCASKTEEVVAAADSLGYAFLLLDSENRAGTQNALTIVWPFAEPLTVAQYARIASCFATQMNVYGLLEGALAATHIVNVHGTSKMFFGRGAPLDGAAYIKRTAKDFQGLDARKFEGRESIGSKAAKAQIARPFFTTDDGLFEMPMSDAEVQQMDADAVLARLGVRLKG